MTQSIVIYSKGYCPYCKHAKALLTAKGAAFTEIDITDNDVLAVEMIERSGRRTVPQIFIGDVHVGGASDLTALDNEGNLDPLLMPFLTPKHISAT